MRIWPVWVLAALLPPAGAAGQTAEVEAVRPVTIVVTGPQDVRAEGPVTVDIRIFDGEDPDAPPQVTNIAVKSVAAETLALPMTVEVEVPAARLAVALRPMAGVLVTRNGAMAYWSDALVALSGTGPTEVRLAPVP